MAVGRMVLLSREILAHLVVEYGPKELLRQAICCDGQGATLNLVAHESAPVRDASTELANQPPDTTLRVLQKAALEGRVPDLVLPKRHMLFPELYVDTRPVVEEPV